MVGEGWKTNKTKQKKNTHTGFHMRQGGRK